MSTKIESQTQKILHHLMGGNAITPREALQKFGCLRLGARIWDLKQGGHQIAKQMVKVGDAHVAQYELEFFKCPQCGFDTTNEEGICGDCHEDEPKAKATKGGEA